MTENFEFPQYRMYKNGKSVFKVSSIYSFIELQLIGSNVIQHSVEAKILPDRNFISDMLYDFEENWDKISAEDYKVFADKINS
tara:strand:- start:4527 stop:4775 length:249 start_codon:yes stop_codon:yes gene_type:complete